MGSPNSNQKFLERGSGKSFCPYAVFVNRLYDWLFYLIERIGIKNENKKSKGIG